jgi:hypothetical protein
MVTRAEASYFLRHCEVAALLLDAFSPLDPATSSHVVRAIRMATLNAAGKNGVSHASTQARKRKEATGKPWHQCGLIKEHAVPVSLIYRRVLDAFSAMGLGDPSLVDLSDLAADEQAFARRNPKAWSIAKIVREETVLAWITADEDAELRKRGLQRCMPPGWDESQSRFARYETCGIECWAI